MRPADRPAVLRAWVPAVTLAAFAGVAVPLAVGALTAGTPTPVVATAYVGAGAGAGAVLGWAQAAVLRRFLPAVHVRRWTVRTAAGGGAATALALLPALTVAWWNGWPPALLVAATGLLAALAATSVGLAQWTGLRGHVEHAGRWVAWSGLAWSAGVAVFVAVAGALWVPDDPALGGVGAGLLAVALAALTVATLTGVGLARLLAR